MVFTILSITIYSVVLAMLLYGAFLLGKGKLEINAKNKMRSIKNKIQNDPGVHLNTEASIALYEEQQAARNNNFIDPL